MISTQEKLFEMVQACAARFFDKELVGELEKFLETNPGIAQNAYYPGAEKIPLLFIAIQEFDKETGFNHLEKLTGLLLKHGASPDEIMTFKVNDQELQIDLLTLSIYMGGRQHITEMFITHTKMPDNPEIISNRITVAIALNQKQFLEQLVKRGLDLNSPHGTRSRFSYLTSTALLDREEILQYLIQHIRQPSTEEINAMDADSYAYIEKIYAGVNPYSPQKREEAQRELSAAINLIYGNAASPEEEVYIEAVISRYAQSESKYNQSVSVLLQSFLEKQTSDKKEITLNQDHIDFLEKQAHKHLHGIHTIKDERKANAIFLEALEKGSIYSLQYYASRYRYGSYYIKVDSALEVSLSESYTRMYSVIPEIKQSRYYESILVHDSEVLNYPIWLYFGLRGLVADQQKARELIHEIAAKGNSSAQFLIEAEYSNPHLDILLLLDDPDMTVNEDHKRLFLADLKKPKHYMS